MRHFFFNDDLSINRNYSLNGCQSVEIMKIFDKNLQLSPQSRLADF